MTTVVRALTSLLFLYVISVAMTSVLPASVPAYPLRNIRRTVSAVMTTSTTARTTDVAGNAMECPRGYFFSVVAKACQACSGCPINQIIRRPCSPLADTLCGPFIEFDKFHQAPNAGAEKNGARSGRKEQSESGFYVQGKPASGQRSEESAAADQRSESLRKAGDQWRTLSFALIGVLSFICCVVVIVGLYVCVLLRRSQTQKLIIREPEFIRAPLPYEDPEPRYVETVVTSRDRTRTASRRQLPRVYEQILTAGEGDASEFPPLTSSSACDVKTGEVVRQADARAERLCVYINTALLDVQDS